MTVDQLDALKWAHVNYHSAVRQLTDARAALRNMEERVALQQVTMERYLSDLTRDTDGLILESRLTSVVKEPQSEARAIRISADDSLADSR